MMTKEQSREIFENLKMQIRADAIVSSDVDESNAGEKWRTAFHDVELVCREFFQSTEPIRKDIITLLDDHLIKIFEKFINAKIASIKCSADSDHLLFGLVAVVIIGDRSDPRDVIFWALELYREALRFKIPHLESIFENVSGMAPKEMRSSSFGLSSVSSEIGGIPHSERGHENRNSLRHENRLPELSALMKAAINNDLQRVRELIESGENIDFLQNGASALAFAAFLNNVAIVELLINRGASVHVCPYGIKLLAYARLGRATPELLNMLKKAGAEL